MAPIRTTAELYAHALAMEQEAAQRYVELALRAREDGNGELADLFWRLGHEEGRHHADLLRRSADMLLPRVPPIHGWFEEAAPETARRDLIFRLMTPRQAIAIAIEAERRARDFFDSAARSATDSVVRELARKMAEEENEHIALLLRALERAPKAPATANEWERLFIEAAA